MPPIIIPEETLKSLEAGLKQLEDGFSEGIDTNLDLETRKSGIDQARNAHYSIWGDVRGILNNGEQRPVFRRGYSHRNIERGTPHALVLQRYILPVELLGYPISHAMANMKYGHKAGEFNTDMEEVQRTIREEPFSRVGDIAREMALASRYDLVKDSLSYVLETYEGPEIRQS